MRLDWLAQIETSGVHIFSRSTDCRAILNRIRILRQSYIIMYYPLKVYIYSYVSQLLARVSYL